MFSITANNLRRQNAHKGEEPQPAGRPKPQFFACGSFPNPTPPPPLRRVFPFFLCQLVEFCVCFPPPNTFFSPTDRSSAINQRETSLVGLQQDADTRKKASCTDAKNWYRKVSEESCTCHISASGSETGQGSCEQRRCVHVSVFLTLLLVPNPILAM